MPVSVTRGDSPLVLAQPHSGVFVPPEIFASLNDVGKELVDTDWHVPTLYEGLVSNATVVRANFSRYVVDANRNPAGGSLYPGQNTTGLVPETTFDGTPIWINNPSPDDIAERMASFHTPYHAALRAELDRVQELHGVAVLYDCHSIRSRIPHLFEGSLPDLSVGTNSGLSCGPELSAALMDVCATQQEFSYVLNGRFKGGWTTRHYGDPTNGIHAIQMEIAQVNYLHQEHPPFAYDEALAARLRSLLMRALAAILQSLDSYQNGGQS